MKALKLLFGLLFVSMILTSCVIEEDHYYDEPVGPTIEEIITSHDIWYVDFNRTTGYGDVPFISKAFTLSFDHGKMFANNNIVGIGFTGDGYGLETGTYSTRSRLLKLNNYNEGSYNFEVTELNLHSISLYNASEDVTYYLEGYTIDDFDFDQVFYDNMEYFLQEYEEWAKVFTSEEGEINAFDNENFLSFTPENITTFYSSVDDVTTPLSERIWDFVGSYTIADIIGHDTIKDLTLEYDNGDIESFELSVIDDANVRLYHYDSGTTYEFEGVVFIQFKKGNKTNGRKRFKVARKAIPRKQHNETGKKEHIKGSEIKAPNRK